MAVNPNGYVPVFDAGTPKIISGRAREAINSGEFVYASGAAGVVGASASTFDPTTDLLFATNASGLNFVGVALADAGSNEPVSVAVDGVVIARAAGAVNASVNVMANGGHAVVAGSSDGHVIGRAYSSATSGGYCLVHIGRS